jgi:hypothetical protein
MIEKTAKIHNGNEKKNERIKKKKNRGSKNIKLMKIPVCILQTTQPLNFFKKFYPQNLKMGEF